MEYRIARYISFIFNPLIIPTLFFVIGFSMPFHFSLQILPKAKWMITGLVSITSFVLPVILSLIFGRGVRLLVSFDSQDEKIFLLAIVVVFYFLTYYLLRQIPLSPVFSVFLLGITTLAVLALLITLIWNISIYMMSAGALFGAFCSFTLLFAIDLNFLVMILILFSGILAYSRLLVSNHSPAQVYTGFILGAVVMVLHYLYYI